MMMESSNDWDLQAVVRSCSTAACSRGSAAVHHNEEEAARPAVVVEAGAEFLWQQPAAATSLRDLDYSNQLDHEAPFSITPASDELLISFPAAAGQSRKQQGGRKPAGGVRAPRPKRSKKSQLKKVVCQVPDGGGVSTDLWAWRKYGQKPIKGSPYPRGYYKCSSLKACVARKLVERNPDRPDVLVVTYIGEHCHAVPTMLSSLAGNTTRNSRPEASTTDDQSDKQREESAEASSMTVDGGSAETPPDDDNALWPVLDMSPLDEYDYSLVDGFLVGPPFDDDVDLYLEDDDGLGMMSL